MHFHFITNYSFTSFGSSVVLQALSTTTAVRGAGSAISFSFRAFRLGRCPSQDGESKWQNDKSAIYTVGICSKFYESKLVGLHSVRTLFRTNVCVCVFVF